MNKKLVQPQAGQASDSEKNKTFRVTITWDGREVWEIQAPHEDAAVDEALLGLGQLITELAGYRVQNVVVEEVGK